MNRGEEMKGIFLEVFFGGQCMPKCTHVVVASPFSRVTQRPVF